jgi:hypothetical protein
MSLILTPCPEIETIQSPLWHTDTN